MANSKHGYFAARGANKSNAEDGRTLSATEMHHAYIRILRLRVKMASLGFYARLQELL